MFLIAKFLVEVELTVHAGMAALVHTNFIIKELDFTLLNDMSCEIKREESIEDEKTHFRDIYIKSIMKIILVFCLSCSGAKYLPSSGVPDTNRRL